MAASFMYIRFPDGIELGPIPTHRVREAVLEGHLAAGTVVRPDSSAVWISESSWASGVFEEAPVVPTRRVTPSGSGERQVRMRLLSGGEIGPIPESMIRRMIECRLLEPKDLVQRVGSERWREAGTVAARLFADREQRAQPENPGVGATVHAPSAHASAPSSQPTIVKVVTAPPKPMSRSERFIRVALLVGVPILILIGALARPMERWTDASSERTEATETLAAAVEAYGLLVEQEGLADSASFNLSEAVAKAQSEADQLAEALDRIRRRFNEADQLVTWAETISQEIQDRAVSQAQTRKWLTDALLSFDRSARELESAQGSDQLSGRGIRRPQSQRTADALQNVREVEAKVIHLQQSLAEESEGIQKAVELLPRIHEALRELPLLEAASEVTESATVKARADLARLRRAEEAVQRRESAQTALVATNAAYVDATSGVRKAVLWAVLGAAVADLLLLGLHSFGARLLARSQSNPSRKPVRRASNRP